MIEITKEVARRFFEIDPRQNLVISNGHAIWSLESYIEDGKIVELEEKDIEHLVQRHVSGTYFKNIIFDNNGNPLEYLDGIDNKDFLRWFANQIGASTEYADTKMGRGFWAQACAGSIYSRLEELAEFTPQELKEAEAKAKKLEEDNPPELF